jgi:uncharacterized protein YjbI with pentapeptide repeats
VARAWSEDEWAQVKKRLDAEGTVDAQEVILDAATVEWLLRYAPRVEGRPHFAKANFHRATFEDRVSFDGATFRDGAWFDGATFRGGASFGAVTFGDVARFKGANFGDRTWFIGTRFKRGAWFDGATFGDEASFENAIFGASTSFEGVHFGDGAEFGPLLVMDQLSLDAARFPRPATMDITALVISAQRIQVPFGATLIVRWAELDLEGAVLPQPTIIALRPAAMWDEEFAIVIDPESGLPQARYLHPVTRELDPRPRLVSLQFANVENLILSDVNLAPCQLDRAYNLDRLRWEESTGFAPAPSIGMWCLRERGRQALAAEHEWRAERRSGTGWNPTTCQPRWQLDTMFLSPDPIRIANSYRALRKAREDAKDAPGAADFYYGEMEMRRLAAPRWSAEWILLTAYWFSCGYALRAWRAFACVAFFLLVGAGLFTVIGFDRSPVPVTRPDRILSSGQLHYATALTPPPSHGFWDGLAFAVDTSTSLLRTPSEPRLTGWGKFIEVVLRFAGPLLLGLGLLSLRGRVKR